MYNKKENSLGITLIALVVTIIVLLILAGISISMLAGQNGILTRSKQAKEETRVGTIQEARDMWIQEREMEEVLGQTPKTLDEELKELEENNTITAEEKSEITNSANKSLTIGSKTISFYVIDTEDRVEPKNIADWNYEYNEDGTITITGYKGNDTEVVFPNWINGKRVKAIVPAEGNEKEPVGLDSDGKYIMGYNSIWMPEICTTKTQYSSVYAYGQGTITSIEISEGIEEIGADAFGASAALTDFKLPSSIKKMEIGVFNNCNGLTKISMPDNMYEIGDSAFFYCRNLEDVNIPNNVKKIGSGAFAMCQGLKSVTIENGVTEIGEYAFSRCHDLKNIIIPSSVTTIGSYAFSYCDSLNTIAISSSVTTLGENVFKSCTSLTEINCEAFSSKPDGWSDTWYGDCSTDIIKWKTE